MASNKAQKSLNSLNMRHNWEENVVRFHFFTQAFCQKFPFVTPDEFFYVWLFYGSGKTHNWCYGWSTEAGKLSSSRPFMEYPEKLARLACGSRLSRSLARFSKQVSHLQKSLRAQKEFDNCLWHHSLDRRKEKLGEIFVTDVLCNQSILCSVSSKAFSCWQLRYFYAFSFLLAKNCTIFLCRFRRLFDGGANVLYVQLWAAVQTNKMLSYIHSTTSCNDL